MIVTVDVRNVYGRETIYPADRTAQIFADIAGTATLTRATVEYIKRLGYTVVSAASVRQL